ncbi:hypothetical protein J6590_082124 [Homalodisca vitripennis]|nr:hypothetical protein J6590_082124 [Homalodisca vitripennis]
MIPLVECGSRLGLSATVDVNGDDEDYHTSSPSTTYKPIKHGINANMLSRRREESIIGTTSSYRSPKREKLRRLQQPHQPIYAPKSYHTPSPSTSYMPFRDADERLNSIIPANESQASMIVIVGSGTRLRLSAAVAGMRIRPPVIDHQVKEVSRIRPNFINQKLPHILSVNERQANWRHGGKPIYCRSCNGILGLHDSSREKRVQAENFGSS